MECGDERDLIFEHRDLVGCPFALLHPRRVATARIELTARALGVTPATPSSQHVAEPTEATAPPDARARDIRRYVRSARADADAEPLHTPRRTDAAGAQIEAEAARHFDAFVDVEAHGAILRPPASLRLLDALAPCCYAPRMLTTLLAPDTKATPDDGSFAGSLVITLLPLVIVALAAIPLFRFLRRSQQRSLEYLKINRDMLDEVRQIRELLQSKRT